jgi:HTH-type transcriptional regulator / antitoxin HigA
MSKRPGKLSVSYLRLIGKFPLRPIETMRDYDDAARIVEKLAIRAEEDLDEGESQYLGALATLIEAFDQEHYAEMGARSGPVELLRHLMEQRGMTTADVGRILGSRSSASMVLNGDRELSKAQILALAEYFKIGAGAFLDERRIVGKVRKSA